MRTRRREMAWIAAALLAMAGVLGWAQAARATAPPCQVFGHLEPAPGHVTAVFTVAKTCAEVSVVSWLAPDAHAGQPQTLYDRHSESDVAPGDYRWTITAPPEGCFFQDDLALPGGYTIDFILGGDHVCETTPSSTSTSLANTTSTTESVHLSSSTTIGTEATTLAPSTTVKPVPVSSPPSGELAFSGGGELWALTLGALGLIGAGRWFEHRAKKRRA